MGDGTVAYGTLATSATKDTTTGDLNDPQTATNNGNITEAVNIKGQSTTAWTLAGAAGADQYKHEFCITTCNTSPTWTALTTSYQTLAASVATSGTQVFYTKITAPSSSSSFTQQSADITIQAVSS